LPLLNKNDFYNKLYFKKDGLTFWKCWRSKFEFGNKCTEIEGIADKFARDVKNIFMGKFRSPED